MDSSVPMILPKGIVVNTTNIYQEVARYPTVPAAKIWEYWHVYTTTNKKLKDPTARRLENFWWQVWGSNRRHLSGQALARIYEDISVGPTFVPLHGPPNRWEGPDVPPLTEQLIAAHLSRGLGSAQGRPEPPRTKSNDVPFKSVSSASKPPPSHPILKKSRSPLGTGPRHTARFASPPQSDDEGGKGRSHVRSSENTATAPLATDAESTEKPVPATQKSMKTTGSTSSPSTPSTTTPSTTPTTTTMTMTTATATATNTTRPALDRRGSHRSSRAMGGASRARPSPKEPQAVQTHKGTTAPTLERSTDADVAPSESREREKVKMVRPTTHPRLSAKAAGKRPAMVRTISKDSHRATRVVSRPALSPTVATTSNSLARNISGLRSPVSAKAPSRSSLSPTVANSNSLARNTSGLRSPVATKAPSRSSLSPTVATSNSSARKASGLQPHVAAKDPSQSSLSPTVATLHPPVRKTSGLQSPVAAKAPSRSSLSPIVATSNSLARNTSGLRSPVSTRSVSLTTTGTDNSIMAGSVADYPMTTRSATQNGYARKKMSTLGLFTSATATTTNIAVQGQIIDQAGSLPTSSILDADHPADGATLNSHPSATSLMNSRMVPTQPSQTASVPMGRTRSQLKLLLEREKSRVGDKSLFRS